MEANWSNICALVGADQRQKICAVLPLKFPDQLYASISQRWPLLWGGKKRIDRNLSLHGRYLSAKSSALSRAESSKHGQRCQARKESR